MATRGEVIGSGYPARCVAGLSRPVRRRLVRPGPGVTRAGCAKPGSMQLRIFLEPQQGATYDQQLAVAQSAEQLGFDAFFRSDHFLTMAGNGLPESGDLEEGRCAA